MNLANIELPSNRKFGFFFTLVFGVTAIYFYLTDSKVWVYPLCLVMVILLFISIFIPGVLLPANKLWTRFGILLGTIVGPIVLGIIFFGLFTPISFIMRLFGRDELKLKFRTKRSHWMVRDVPMRPNSFTQQF